MSASKFGLGAISLALAFLPVSGVTKAAEGRAGAGQRAKIVSNFAGTLAETDHVRVNGMRHASVFTGRGSVTTATRTLDLGTLNPSDFGDEPVSPGVR